MKKCSFYGHNSSCSILIHLNTFASLNFFQEYAHVLLIINCNVLHLNNTILWLVLTSPDGCNDVLFLMGEGHLHNLAATRSCQNGLQGDASCRCCELSLSISKYMKILCGHFPFDKTSMFFQPFFFFLRVFSCFSRHLSYFSGRSLFKWAEMWIIVSQEGSFFSIVLPCRSIGTMSKVGKGVCVLKRIYIWKW